MYSNVCSIYDNFGELYFQIFHSIGILSCQRIPFCEDLGTAELTVQRSDGFLHDPGPKRKETNGIVQVKWGQDIKIDGSSKVKIMKKYKSSQDRKQAEGWGQGSEKDQPSLFSLQNFSRSPKRSLFMALWLGMPCGHWHMKLLLGSEKRAVNDLCLSGPKCLPYLFSANLLTLCFCFLSHI